jgi:mono/diheme cytochrome c family protein
MMRLPRIAAIFQLGAAVAMADVPEPVRLLLEQNCTQCHGPDEQNGGVRLDDVEAITPALWATMYEQLASWQMPPDDDPQLAEADRRSLIRHALAIAGRHTQVTTTGFRRLNKREYGHTVRDLLGLRGTFDPGEYIRKDETSGFDTDAQSLVVSNEALVEYLNAADKSLRHALFTETRHQPESRAMTVNLAEIQGTSSRYINHGPTYVIGRCGNRARAGKLYDGLSTRVMREPGRYKITVTACAVDRDAYGLRFAPARGPVIMGFGVQPDDPESLSSGGTLLRHFVLQDDVDQTFEFEAWIDKDHVPYFSFVNGSSKPITQVRQAVRQGRIEAEMLDKPYAGPGIRISRFQLEGPLFEEWPPATIRTALGVTEMPDFGDAAARERMVKQFATRAFRRPVGGEEVEPYLAYLDEQYRSSHSWREALIRTFAALMTSVDFLYRREAARKLTANALANRLSYALWSSMPDAELLALAESGELEDPGVLRAQAERLLQDPRSESFCRSFADQWLSLDTLGTMPPDLRGEYRTYHDRRLEPAMLEETRRFVRHVLHENRSVRDFLDSDYTFVNADLAAHYGVAVEPGDADFLKTDFHRVAFPPGSLRGGLLGHGSILTLTSNGVETTPIIRGHWILKELLGTPPPPPPKEVPALAPDINGATTVREQLEKHRTDASCASCHRQMDPLGFALESFDPIGGLRTRYSKAQAVSTYGEYRGRAFHDVSGLRKILAANLRPFARHLTIQMAEYAKGRKLIAADCAEIEDVLDRAAADDFRLQDLLVAVVTGDLIRNR